MATSESKNSLSLVDIISTAIQIPGVKTDRSSFLREQFKGENRELIENIVAVGPVQAGCTRKQLQQMSRKLIQTSTRTSTAASFVAGLPGGLAIAATLPADMLQFYGIALRLAQELSYLYGEPDLWSGAQVDNDKIRDQLVLYCGVMLGASGAVQTVRVLTSAIAKQALKKIPQKALTKTFYYPIVKSIAKAFSVKMTKGLFAKGISKAVPLVGGIVSGGLTFATMNPMGNRLAEALDKAHFSYTETDFESDWQVIVAECKNDEPIEIENVTPTTTVSPLEEITRAKKATGRWHHHRR